jgi:hypothetical protein
MSDGYVEIRIKGTNASKPAFKEAEADAKDHGNKVTTILGQAGERAGEALGEGIKRGSDGKLRDARGRFVKEGKGLGEGLGEGIKDGLGDGVNAGTSMFGRFLDTIVGMASVTTEGVGKTLASLFPAGASFLGLTAATGGVNLLVGAFLLLVAAAAAALAGLIVLAPTLLLIGGAAGSVTTLLVGLGGAVAVLGLGLGGLSDAWTAYGLSASGGGVSSAAAARQVVQAQREVKSATLDLADAQNAARQAQEAVTQARLDESERLSDLQRNLASAQRDEEGAILAVTRAEQRLREVRRQPGRTALDVKEAELALRQAVGAVDDMRDHVDDLSKEQAAGAKKGVEGSDAVQSALERQKQAQRSLEQATWRLADAQKAVAEGAGGAAGGVDKFAEAMAKLSPNAQALIKTLIALKPKFDELKKSTQDRLLEGIDTSVKDLATKWLPTLGPMLGGLAGSFNKVGKSLLDSLGKKDFIENISTAMAGFGRFVERVGGAISGPLVDAFGRLAAASAPFLETLGDKIAGLVENFSAWIKTADESGSLTSFMESASRALSDIWSIGGLTIDILGEIVSTLWPGSKRESSTFLGGVIVRMQEFRDWLADPENKQKIQDWIERIQDLGKAAFWVADKVGGLIDMVSGWVDRVSEWATAVGKTKDKIKKNASGLFDGLKDAFKSALNWIIDRWNGLRFTLPSVNLFGNEIGGGSIGTSHINRFAQGGIGGGLAWVGERGRELVNLPQGSQVIPHGSSEAMAAGGGGGGAREVRLIIELRNATTEVANLIRKIVNVEGGGDVSVAFGKASR